MNKADRTAIDLRVNQLAGNNKGVVTPDMIWQEAQNPTSVFRKYTAFEWDETDAWNKHNLAVARNLIASVVIKVRVNKVIVKIPQFTRDPSLPEDTQGYMNVQQVQQLNQMDIAKQIISQELGRTRQALDRAQGYASYFKMEADIKKLTNSIKKLEERLAA
jgi:hypothetical protein